MKNERTFMEIVENCENTIKILISSHEAEIQIHKGANKILSDLLNNRLKEIGDLKEIHTYECKVITDAANSEIKDLKTRLNVLAELAKEMAESYCSNYTFKNKVIEINSIVGDI